MSNAKRPYRDPERVDIPVTEGEFALKQIEEDAKTIRERNAQRAEAAKDRREKLATFFSYDGTMMVFGLLSVTLVGTLCTIAIMYAHARLYR